MKAYHFFFFFCAGIFFALEGCSNKEIVDSNDTGLTAVFAPDTRTSYAHQQGTNFTWDSNDLIALMTTDGDANVMTGTLTPILPDRTRASVALSGGSGTRTGYAIYPSTSFGGTGTESSSPFFLVNYPDNYDLTNRGDDWSPVPMYAENNPASNQLLFHHLGGLARISCSNIPTGTSSLVLTQDDGAYLSGTAKIYYDAPGPRMESTSATGTGNVITFNGVSSGGACCLNVPLMGMRPYKILILKAMDAGNNRLKEMFIDYPIIPSSNYGKGYLIPVDMSDPYMEIEFVSPYNGVAFGNYSPRESRSCFSETTKAIRYVSNLWIGSTTYQSQFKFYNDYLEISGSSTHLNVNLYSHIYQKMNVTRVEVDFSSSIANTGFKLGYNSNTTSFSELTEFKVGSSANTRVTRSYSFTGNKRPSKIQIKSTGTQILKIYAIRIYYNSFI